MNNHRVCETWILEDAELTSEERRMLHAHLAECDSCRELQANLNEGLTCIKNAPAKVPLPGFTERWNTLRKQRESEMTAAYRFRVIFGMVLLLGALSVSFLSIIFSPDNFGTLILRLSAIATNLSSFQTAAGKVLSTFHTPFLIIGIVMFGLLVFYVFALFMSAYTARKERAGKEQTVYEEK